MNFLLRVASLVVVLGIAVAAQSGEVTCDSKLEYANKNQIDYTVSVKSLRGVVEDLNGVRLPKACVGLFSSDGTRLLQVKEADENGEFQITNVRNGEYRLLIRDSQRLLCPVNAVLRVGKDSRLRRVVAHMKPQGIDECSWCEAQE